MRCQKKILAVDDEVSNLAIMDVHFAQAGYQMVPAEDGMIALKKLEENPGIAAIVLDRTMPNLGGMEFLQKIKADARFTDMPVVMLTGAATVDAAVESIAAGVRYHLTKPYSGAMLIEIVKLALQEVRNIKSLKEEIHDFSLGLGLMQQARFNFRTLEEATNLAYKIATCFPQPQKAAFGLNELMRNAVEHGNLGIGYDEKANLLRSGSWQDEVERRLNLSENLGKFASLTFETTEEAVAIHIKDQGRGFDWQRYLDFSPERAAAPHGRGIAACRALSFPSLEYLGGGNEARCAVLLRQD
jgi:DNA-binding response OmpR family regulator